MIKTQSYPSLHITTKMPLQEKLKNRFKVVESIGKGAYGQVFWIIDQDQNHYAMKRIKVRNQRNGLGVLILREVSILKELNHPNIIKLQKWNYCWKG